MVEKKETEMPLLMDELTAPEKVMLGITVGSPGFRIYTRICEAARLRSMAKIAELNPEEPDYDHKLSVRAQHARTTEATIELIRKSVNYHTQNLQTQAENDKDEAEAAVAKTFGIHTVKPRVKKEEEVKQ
jgi:hypothetical protein